MGRYMTGNSQPRRRIVTLFASNPSVPIPVWARSGKSIALVTGVGGGSSGAVKKLESGTRYGGGGAGAFAVEHPVIIPAGLATCSVLIGAGGAAVTANADTLGTVGGATVLTLGAAVLGLLGGGNGDPANPDRGGFPYVGGPSAVAIPAPGILRPLAGGFGTTTVADGVSGPASRLSKGADGRNDTAAAGGSTGGWSPWGAAPLQNALPVNGVNAQATVGYGAGGSGVATNGPVVTSGEGRPGFLTIEFVEGF